MSALTEPGLIGGRYRIIGPLGSGNMGDVHRAVHAVTGQKIALKIIKPHVAQGQGAVTRFLREVQAAATIDHPGVVQVFDAGAHENTLYIAMELLEGESLRERLKRGVPRQEVLLILRRLLDPLAEAHRSGIIHRDLKPDNVFVAGMRDETVVKLLDFGIASDLTHVGATQTGLTVGTPHYMSPEQAIDPRTCTPATDVWALGVMLYEVLAGKVPFDGVTAHGVLIKAISQPYPELPDSVEAPLRALVDRCLQKDQKDRPADAAALAVAFDRAVPRLEALTDFTVRALRPRLDTGGDTQLGRQGGTGTGAGRAASGDSDLGTGHAAAARPRNRGVWIALGGLILGGAAAVLAFSLGGDRTGAGDVPVSVPVGASVPAAATPGSAAATPGSAAATPGSAAATPGSAAATLASAPGSAAATPGSAAATPASAAATVATIGVPPGAEAVPAAVTSEPAARPAGDATAGNPTSRPGKGPTRPPASVRTAAPTRVAASNAPPAIAATEPEAPVPPVRPASAPASQASAGDRPAGVAGAAPANADRPPVAPPTVAPPTADPPPVRTARPLRAKFGPVQIDGALPRASADQALEAVRSAISGCVRGLPPRLDDAQAQVVFELDADGFVAETRGSGDPEGVRCGKASARSFRLGRRPDTGSVRLTLPVALVVDP